MVNTCKTCKHWEPAPATPPVEAPYFSMYGTEGYAARGYGTCNYIPSFSEFDTGVTAPAFIPANFDYMPLITNGAVFGCTLHEEQK